MRLKNSLHFVHVVVKTLKLVISRSSFDEYGRELFKNACRTCSTIFLVILTNNITAFWRCRCSSRRRFLEFKGSFSNDNGDGNENVTNLHIQWAKTVALHAPHVRFSFLSISLPLSAKQQREITKFEVLWTLLFSRSRFNSKKGVKKKGTKRLHFWSKIHSGIAYSVFGVKCTPISFTPLLG